MTSSAPVSSPSTVQGLEALVSEPSGFPEARKWNPVGYLKNVPVDPWGEPYLYLETDGSVEIKSQGADGQIGGEGANADISNANLQ